jgi:hypothetical protein
LVTRNALPENRFYRYDYFLDNCSTRVRDALDTVLGGSLKRRFTVLTTDWTFRSESVRLTTPAGLAQAGIDLALGPKADVPITAWESMFIPMRLMEYLRDVTVPGADGAPVPLVLGETVLYHATRAPEPAERRGSHRTPGPIPARGCLLAPLSLARRQRTCAPRWRRRGTASPASWRDPARHVGRLGPCSGTEPNLLVASPIGLVADPRRARDLSGETLLARWLVPRSRTGRLAVVLALVGPQTMGGPLLLLLPAHIGLAVTFFRHASAAGAATAVAGAA